MKHSCVALFNFQRLPRMLILAFVLCSFSGLGEELPSLNNDKIIEMVKAQIAPSIIEHTISASASSFDVSADGLITLKAAGVPDSILQAMITKGVNDTTHHSQGAPSRDCNFKESGPLIMLAGSQRLELQYVTPEFETKFGVGAIIGRGKGYAMLKGGRAIHRLTSPVTPVFEEIYVPVDRRPEDVVVLARLNAHTDHRDIEIANVKFLGGKSGIPDNYIIPVDFEAVETKTCVYNGKEYRHVRTTSKTVLEPGEYCYIVSGSMFFDFGVD